MKLKDKLPWLSASDTYSEANDRVLPYSTMLECLHKCVKVGMFDGSQSVAVGISVEMFVAHLDLCGYDRESHSLKYGQYELRTFINPDLKGNEYEISKG